MPTRYDLLYLMSTPVLLPYLGWRRVARGKYTESARGMRGQWLPAGEAARPFRNGSIWIHAVSVGEVTAARAIAPGLRRLLPELPLVVSTVTETGQRTAREAFPDDHITYFPADLSRNVARFQQTFQPRIFVLLETEIWPNFLTLAARRGTPCFMVNGKLSERSFPRYRRFRGVLRPALDALRGICTQTRLDAERFGALGIPPGRIRVTGNCKFDVAYPTLTEEERTGMMAEFGMDPGRVWIVAGSTHPGEERVMLRALGEVRGSVPEAGLVLCPRHPERFEEVARQAAEAGWRVGRASRAGEVADPEVVVLDRMGVLARTYGLGRVAVVAGSFGRVGGHNLLEAAAHGVPVVYGPAMHAQREIVRLFEQAGAGVQVEPAGLGGELGRLMTDEAARQQEGDRSLRAVAASRGSADRALEAIAGWLNR